MSRAQISRINSRARVQKRSVEPHVYENCSHKEVALDKKSSFQSAAISIYAQAPPNHPNLVTLNTCPFLNWPVPPQTKLR